MSILKSLSRKFLFPAVLKTGLEKVPAYLTENNFLVLNYHGVVKNYDDSLTRNHLSVEQFEDHLKYFQTHFDVLPLQEIFKFKNHPVQRSRKSISITFDDGYLNNYTNAYPLLKSYNFPATIFVSAQAITNPRDALWYDVLDLLHSRIKYKGIKDKLGQSSLGKDIADFIDYADFKKYLKTKNNLYRQNLISLLLNDDKLLQMVYESNSEYWKLMGHAEVKELAQSALITIGSHSVTHSNLDVLSNEELNFELSESKKILEEASGHPVNSIAFPDGAYNENVKKCCLENNYTMMLAVDFRTPTDQHDPFILPRLSISNTTTAESVMIQANISFRKYGF